jgi:uncharacterized protein (DUF1499 family)
VHLLEDAQVPENQPAASKRDKPPRKWRWRLALLPAFLIFLGAMVVGNWFAGKPENLGASNGRLSNCPDSPNCVCSQDDRETHHVKPFNYQGDGKAAFARLTELLRTWPRAKIIAQTENYLHVEFTTPTLRFVDDAEFLLVEEDKVIHARSAARVGYSDMDVNRKRIEDIRAAYESEN